MSCLNKVAMKKIITILVLLFLTQFKLKAQTLYSAVQLADKETKAMQSSLHLDSSQVRQIFQILSKHYKQVDSVKNSAISNDNKVRLINDFYIARRESIQLVLTAEQLIQYQEKIEAMRGRMQSRRQAPSAVPKTSN